jgi:hypothetical protein
MRGRVPGEEEMNGLARGCWVHKLGPFTQAGDPRFRWVAVESAIARRMLSLFCGPGSFP